MPVITSAVVGTIVAALAKAVGEGIANKIAESITGGGVTEKQIERFTDAINVAELVADAIHDAWRDDGYAGAHVADNLGDAAQAAGFNAEQIAWMKVQIYSAFGGNGGKAFWIKKLAIAKQESQPPAAPSSDASVSTWLDYFTSNPSQVPPPFKGAAKLKLIRQTFDGDQSARDEAIARFHNQWGEIFDAAAEGPLSEKWKHDQTVQRLSMGQGSFLGFTGIKGIQLATSVHTGEQTIDEARASADAMRSQETPESEEIDPMMIAGAAALFLILRSK